MADTPQAEYVGLALSHTRQHRIPCSYHGVAIITGKTHAAAPFDLHAPAGNRVTISATAISLAISLFQTKLVTLFNEYFIEFATSTNFHMQIHAVVI